MKTSVSTLLPALLALFCAPAQAQTPISTPAPISAQTVAKLVAKVGRETSELRQLPLKTPVKSGVKTRAEVEAMLQGRARKEMPSDQVQASQLFLRQVGLAPADFDLKSTYIRMMGEQIAGYYDPKIKTFVTTDRVDALQLETVMAHELTHALQDQSFDLSRLEKWPDHDGDAQLAFSSLIEGDATLVMTRYMTRNPLRFFGTLASSLKSQAASPTYNAAPRVLRDSITFPYLKGVDFATKLFRYGGWEAVSNAFTTLPQSTEQILHFDKYLAREAPVQVRLRDLRPVLGPGWKLLDHDVNGEMGLFLTVAEHLGDESAAREASAGWAGDRYAVYREAKGAVLVVQDCYWDSQFDARQWRDAYARSTSKRFGFKARHRGALAVWNAAPRGVWMEQRGKRVLILEGAVGAFSPDAVLAALWR